MNNLSLQGLLNLLLFLTCFLFSRNTQACDPPSIENGILDCQDWDFSSGDYIPISGEVEFYWDTLLHPLDFSDNLVPLPHFKHFPGLWSDMEIDSQQLSSTGYATYRFTILSKDKELPPMALEIPDFYTSYTLWVDGKLFSKNGKVGESKASTRPYWLPKTLALEITKPETEIVLQIANFYHKKGGAKKKIVLGSSESLFKKRQTESMYAFLLTGVMIMSGFYFIGLFMFGKEDRSVVFFALFCFVLSYRMTGTKLYLLHDIFPNFPWELAIRLEYLSLYLGVYLFIEFVSKLFPEECKRLKSVFYFKMVSVALAFSTLLFQAVIFTQVVDIYLVSLVLFICYGSFQLIGIIIKRKQGALYIIAGLLTLFISFSFTIFDYFGLLKPMPLLHFLCYVSFFFFWSLGLSRKFANSYLQLVKAANSATIAKSSFLATMSHEIRTPMNGVIGMTNLLSQTELTKEQKYYLETIQISGENLITIINEILDFSKIESGKVELENRDFDLESTVEEVIKLFKVRAKRKNIKLDYKKEENVPQSVKGDPTRIKQVLINLIGNALKFTEKGSILVHLSKIKLSEGNEKLQFGISDTGIGIPEDKMCGLFEEFRQADSSTARKYGGTGLGLAICHKLVKMMGGEIWVESTLGRGSTFSFTIDLVKADRMIFNTKVVHQNIPSDKVSTRYPLNILLVEDNLINQKLVTLQLKKLGYHADVANNGLEALRALEQKNYELIFMDVQMPEMDGLEATEKIIEKYGPFNRPVIVALTANATLEDKELCLNTGMDDFATKPLKPGIIKALVIKWGEMIREGNLLKTE